MKGWPDVFGTKNKEEVEKELKEQGLDHSWGKDDSLHIFNKGAAVEKHPDTGDTIWFNHLMVSEPTVVPYSTHMHTRTYGQCYCVCRNMSCHLTVVIRNILLLM